VSPDEVIGLEDADDVSVDPNDDVLAGEESRNAVSSGREDDPADAVVPKKGVQRSSMATDRRFEPQASRPAQ
jgi:hypothetical protein